MGWRSLAATSRKDAGCVSEVVQCIPKHWWIWLCESLNSDTSSWCCPRVMCSVGRTTSASLSLIHPVKRDLIKSTIQCLFRKPNLHKCLCDRQGVAQQQPLKKIEVKWPLQNFGCVTILVTGLLFIVPLVQCHSQSLRAVRESRGKSNNYLQVASPSFMLMLNTDGELCTENENHSTSWLLCTRDITLGSDCHFLSPIASLKLLFLSCSAERWAKTMERQFWLLKQTILMLDGEQFFIL